MATTPTGGRKPGAGVKRPDAAASPDFSWLSATPPKAASDAPVRATRPVPSSAISGLEPAIEEAAILYANGNSAEAKAHLMKLLRQEQSGAERIWLMLLDLHQALDEKREFDARALEYALRFHRSAPAWRGADAPSPESMMLRTGGGAYVSLTGKLSAESAPQLEKVLAIAEKNRMLRIDFSKLQGADGPGCQGLLELLQSIRRRGGEAMFSGESVLLGALANATRSGARDVERSLWLLRLEILQWQGRQKEFEEVALGYAVTYEVSPPSFDALAKPEAVKTSADAGDEDGVLKVPRQLIASDESFLGRIEQEAVTRERVVLDCALTDRVDFATAGKLLNLASNLALHGKRLEVRQPNALVAALFDLAGVSAQADIVARK